MGSVRTIARRLLRVHPLRSADALQLAAAVVCAEGECGMLPFVCLDARLIDAARRRGSPSSCRRDLPTVGGTAAPATAGSIASGDPSSGVALRGHGGAPGSGRAHPLVGLGLHDAVVEIRDRLDAGLPAPADADLVRLVVELVHVRHDPDLVEARAVRSQGAGVSVGQDEPLAVAPYGHGLEERRVAAGPRGQHRIELLARDVGLAGLEVAEGDAAREGHAACRATRPRRASRRTGWRRRRRRASARRPS